jgi:small conductance mechanosensitive channel
VDGEGRGYQVLMDGLGDSAVNWIVRFWTNASDFLVVKEQLTAAVKERLDAANIGIPFPQMDVHVHQNP